MENLERELAELRISTEAEVREVRDRAAAEVRHAREDADRDISAARDDAARQVAEAEARAGQAEQDAAKAHQVEVLAITRAKQAQSSAAEETARIRADHQRALDQLTAATRRVRFPSSALLIAGHCFDSTAFSPLSWRTWPHV